MMFEGIKNYNVGNVLLTIKSVDYNILPKSKAVHANYNCFVTGM